MFLPAAAASGQRREAGIVQFRTVARTGLALAAGLYSLCLIVQIFLAGLGVFDSPAAFETHRNFGYTIGLLTLVLVVLSLVGRGPRILIGLSVLTVVLMALQSVFVAMRQSNPTIAALHPVNGVLLLIVSLLLTRKAWALRNAPETESATAAAGGAEATSAR
jgi:hypothetical protein